jgi:uncharacterized protein YyaL (SSP411 family)
MSPTAKNHLSAEKSPYLLQHADNPVDWYPWGDEAIQKAKNEDKPIFLSVGYSTCHWCHVMARESFENAQIAKILNDHFVSIKVDREERPDIDRVYMSFVQATTGSGGWPMSVWLTPDLKPFFGGTYFPPDNRYGRPGFGALLGQIADAWQNRREKVLAQGSSMLDALREHEKSELTNSGQPDAAILDRARRHFNGSFDVAHGGFGGAPKFPRPVTLYFLMREHSRLGKETPDGRMALEMALLTLRKMASGGMRDHLGGGFHRYSVDEFWHVPHFEKMLYDQAQLVIAYCEAFQASQEMDYARVAEDVLEYVRRNLTAPEGAFYCAEDADSLLEHGAPDHAEGAFYVWTRAQIEKILGTEKAEIFCTAYGVEAAGNAPDGADPHGEFTGKNILILRQPVADLAGQFKKTVTQTLALLEECRAQLFAQREKRPRPHRDDKILTAWNGLMISALCRAALALDKPDYAQRAKKAALFIEKNLYQAKTGELRRVYRDGPGTIAGFAEDYAFLICGLLDLYEATAEVHWLQWTVQLQDKMDSIFWDNENGGYYQTDYRDATVLLRMKEDYDGAEPSANSVAALNLLRLGGITAQEKYGKRSREIIRAAGKTIIQMPAAAPLMLCALAAQLQPPLHIILAGKPDDPSLLKLRQEVARRFLPERVLVYADGAAGQQYPAAAYLKDIPSRGAQAYVCEKFVCKPPITDPEMFGRTLEKISG